MEGRIVYQVDLDVGRLVVLAICNPRSSITMTHATVASKPEADVPVISLFTRRKRASIVQRSKQTDGGKDRERDGGLRCEDGTKLTPTADGIDFGSRDLKSRELSVLRSGPEGVESELDVASNCISSVWSVTNAGCFDSRGSDASVTLQYIGRGLRR